MVYNNLLGQMLAQNRYYVRHLRSIPYMLLVDAVNTDVEWIEIVLWIDKKLELLNELAISKHGQANTAYARLIRVRGFNI